MTDSKPKWKSPLERLLNNDGDDPVFRPLEPLSELATVKSEAIAATTRYQDAENDCRTLRAELAAMKKGVVTVKALEWNGGIELADGQKVWAAIAEGMEFTYSIWGGGAEDDGRFFCAKVLPQHFDSLDEAKAAVQQNYDERILSAIDSIAARR